MSITYYNNVIQGSDDWLAMRCGILTASEMKLILTPTLKAASNDKERAHTYELLSQRVTGYVEPSYVSDDMLRGRDDEIEARLIYHKTRAPVREVGFVINDKLGFPIGYSPDGLVGNDGLIECKSRRQKFQVQTFIDGVCPDDFMIQCQTGLFVTERQWIDFISYSGGLPMFVCRVEPDPTYQDAIAAAATSFEARLAQKMEAYRAAVKGLPVTERKVEKEMFS
jgi:hypothetical protein